jgi:hypothetical protein
MIADLSRQKCREKIQNKVDEDRNSNIFACRTTVELLERENNIQKSMKGLPAKIIRLEKLLRTESAQIGQHAAVFECAGDCGRSWKFGRLIYFLLVHLVCLQIV